MGNIRKHIGCDDFSRRFCVRHMLILLWSSFPQRPGKLYERDRVYTFEAYNDKWDIVMPCGRVRNEDHETASEPFGTWHQTGFNTVHNSSTLVLTGSRMEADLSTQTSVSDQVIKGEDYTKKWRQRKNPTMSDSFFACPVHWATRANTFVCMQITSPSACF